MTSSNETSEHETRNAFYWIIWEVKSGNEISPVYVILQKKKFHQKLYKKGDL